MKLARRVEAEQIHLLPPKKADGRYKVNSNGNTRIEGNGCPVR